MGGTLCSQHLLSARLKGPAHWTCRPLLTLPPCLDMAHGLSTAHPQHLLPLCSITSFYKATLTFDLVNTLWSFYPWTENTFGDNAGILMTVTRVGIGDGEAWSFRKIYFIHPCYKPYWSFSSVPIPLMSQTHAISFRDRIWDMENQSGKYSEELYLFRTVSLLPLLLLFLMEGRGMHLSRNTLHPYIHMAQIPWSGTSIQTPIGSMYPFLAIGVLFRMD